MNNATKKVENVADVIQVLQAGIDFYQDAIENIDHNAVKATFRRMISAKEEAIDKLQPLALAEQGQFETGSSWAVEARKMYTKFASLVTSDTEYTYVNQLEEVEDKVLEALDSALEKDQPAEAMATLRTLRASAQTLHDEMKALQLATES